jgi:hypothetical protein
VLRIGLSLLQGPRHPAEIANAATAVAAVELVGVALRTAVLCKWDLPALHAVNHFFVVDLTALQADGSAESPPSAPRAQIV